MLPGKTLFAADISANRDDELEERGEVVLTHQKMQPGQQQ